MKDFWKGLIVCLLLSVIGLIGVADYTYKSKEQKKFLFGGIIGIILGVGIILSITLPIAFNS